MGRRKGREQAFLTVFEKYYHSEKSIPEIIEMAEEIRDEPFDPFALEILDGIVEKFDELDGKIAENSVKWSKERISKVSLAVLRLATYEMLYMDGIPVGVSVNEAVELAKKYGGEEDSSFVNGILGTVARQMAVDKKDDGNNE